MALKMRQQVGAPYENELDSGFSRLFLLNYLVGIDLEATEPFI